MALNILTLKVMIHLNQKIDREKKMFKGNVVGITIRYIEERWTDNGKNNL